MVQCNGSVMAISPEKMETINNLKTAENVSQDNRLTIRGK